MESYKKKVLPTQALIYGENILQTVVGSHRYMLKMLRITSEKRQGVLTFASFE